MQKKISQSVAAYLLMEFGDLAAHGGTAIVAKNLCELTQGAGQSQRRLIYDDSAVVGSELCKPCGAAFLER